MVQSLVGIFLAYDLSLKSYLWMKYDEINQWEVLAAQ